MATADLPRDATLADLLDRIGDVPPARIRLDPPPGRATERDLIRLQGRTDRLYELVEGVLVEKTMGMQESFLGAEVIYFLRSHLREHDIGMVLGADGTVRLMPGLVRIPDVCFTSWDRLPSREVPRKPISDLVPDLAVEVLSPSNTRKEMALKLKEYFLAGVRLVWYVDPDQRSVTVFTAPDQSVALTEDQPLVGGAVLPGFVLPLRELFAKVPRLPAPAKGRRKSS
jgi:Uma2 family endonuclease